MTLGLVETVSVIAYSSKSPVFIWSTLRFSSTLYTHPVLDRLTETVPDVWQPEVRLGLQEALINAVCHGNGLDPTKEVVVQYANRTPIYQWLISDQGSGFLGSCVPHPCPWCCPHEMEESGRGRFIMTQVFDYVEWNGNGSQLYLAKYIDCSPHRQPLIV